MADSGFSLDKLLGWLKNLLYNLPSPIDGFDMDNVNVKQDGDAFTSIFQFKSADLKDKEGKSITDVKGNPIQMNVLLKAINGGEVFQPIFNGLNGMNEENVQKENPLLNILLGTDRTDNTLESAKERGKSSADGGGLLGFDFANANYSLETNMGNYGGKTWSWWKIANDYLKYSLECQAPGRTVGTIENQPLSKCSQLISEYLVKTDVIVNASEVKVDAMILVKPILDRMQIRLAEYYNDAYKKYVDKNQEGSEETEGENPDQQNPNPDQQNPDQQGGEGDQGMPQNPNSSKRISIKLRKIHGSTDFDVLGLQSNYSPAETLEDLDDIISQDEFIKTLPETAQSYSIEVDDDGYDITQCEDCQIDPCESLGQILKSGITMYRNLYILHWMAQGNDMMKLHEMSQEMYEELIEEIDTLGELMVEKCGTIPQPDWCCNYLQVKPYEFQESLIIIVEYIQDYLNTIDYAYPNQTSDVQSTLDEWLRYWNKQMNYFIKGQEI